MTELDSKVGATVDYEADGKQHGYLSIPHSRNDSGWGAVHLPITVVKNGSGPTLTFTGGNHGDEYEGPISLLRLARALDPASITGRVIIIPALNFPAVMAGTRVSPIDGVNMNRAFPGLLDKLVLVFGATPRTLERYTLNQRGAMYGWELAPDQVGPGRLAPDGILNGLVLAGHWTRPGAGVYGTLASGLAAARSVQGLADERALWERLETRAG